MQDGDIPRRENVLQFPGSPSLSPAFFELINGPGYGKAYDKG